MIEPMDLEIRVTSQNKMDKISTMRGMATPQNMLLYKGQKDSLKRLTMKSPLENQSNQRRNQSSLGRHQTNSRLGENRLNSQASRIEQRISRLNNPKQDKQKGEMFFFENQNENKEGLRNSDFKSIKIDQQKLDKYLKRKNYGSKWYIAPKKWEQVMMKSNKKEKRIILKSTWSTLNDPSMASNKNEPQSRSSVLDYQPSKEEMKLNYNPYSKMLLDLKNKEKSKGGLLASKTLSSQNTQKDLVDEFEQNLVDAVAKKEEDENFT